MNTQDIYKYGLQVFNNEEDKFLLWMEELNLYLINNTSKSLLPSSEGIEEVKNCLNRIEYSNFT